eukprot:CAMPEP_0167762914 /NCGR_PEP_ID=MMETSP0110_2-20121227/13050_1 /TAXON_ID=629695 /ORGANISM="Gymnochlora sp., Strain CCMP2014" /LENGTH=305 /DNA_ID=CAMNT_0007649877 /DNA_START=195 /DNA_END=1112 /DNA_ORIENTATION=+
MGIGCSSKLMTSERKLSPNLVMGFLQDGEESGEDSRLETLTKDFPDAAISGAFTEGILGMHACHVHGPTASELEHSVTGRPFNSLMWGYIPDSKFVSLILSINDLRTKAGIMNKLKAAGVSPKDSDWKGFMITSCNQSLSKLLTTLHANYPNAQVAGGLCMGSKVFAKNPSSKMLESSDGVSLLCVGGRVHFTAFSSTVQSDLQSDLKNAYAKIHEAGRLPLCGHLFTCCARGARYYGEHHIESRAFRKVMAPAPIIGMFAGGEIGPPSSKRRRKRSRSEMQGYTAVFAILSIEKGLMNAKPAKN